MKIVIDTNVVISGVFFGGWPRKVLSAVLNEKVSACASEAIIDEYNAVVEEMLARKQGRLDIAVLTPLLCRMEIVEGGSHIEICRDPDDNKFLECAKDAKAVFIVSGDQDLLTLKEYEKIKIMTAKEFCEQYL